MTELELQLQEEVNRLNAQLDGEGTRLIQCRAQVESLEKQCQAMRECSNFLWTIICSAGGGDWSKESDDWQKAACLGREQYHAILSTTASRDYKIAREHQQALLKMAQLPPLTCIKCGDGRTPLYCLNCANEQLESALSQRQDQLRVALDQITELTRQRDVFFARVKALESAAAVPKPEEAK